MLSANSGRDQSEAAVVAITGDVDDLCGWETRLKYVEEAAL